ncbi:MAG: hypothetical protein HGA76_07375 [Candidatus Firestonebacteria bacterium]|nr:hypothetical protein [Candidatus Firestonebacteria bacterium]
MRRPLLLFIIFCLLQGGRQTLAQEKPPTPFEGHRAMAQTLSDMVWDLGLTGASVKKPPVLLPAKTAAPVSSETSQTVAHELQQAPMGSQTTSQPLIPESQISEHQDIQFQGTNPWENQAVTLLFSNDSKFEINVRSPFPVQLWTLLNHEGSLIASGHVNDLTSFYFLIEEDYAPPYSLVLYVNYHDVFYKLKLLLE